MKRQYGQTRGVNESSGVDYIIAQVCLSFYQVLKIMFEIIIIWIKLEWIWLSWAWVKLE